MTKNLANTITAKDFEVQFDEHHTYPFFEDENAYGVYGYGHTDKAEFAAAVNDYDAYCGAATEGYTENDVQHTWGAVKEDPNYEWRFTIVSGPAENTIPITWVSR